MKRIFCRAFVLLLLLASFNLSFAGPVYQIYGLDHASVFQSKARGPFYIQAASFSNKLNAEKYQRQLQAKTHYPVRMIHAANFYRVIIGPLNSTADVRAAGGMSAAPIATVRVYHQQQSSPLITRPTVKVNHSERQYKTTAIRIPAVPHSNMFLSIGAAEQYPMFDSGMNVDNGSDFSAPYNYDTYTTQRHPSPMMILAVGRRWVRDTKWLSSFSMGLSYQNLFATNAGGRVIQYSDPEFTNYNYHLNLSSNILMAFVKANLFSYRFVSPYVNVGVGCAFNRTSNYTETALPNVTPRVSPGFASETLNQFAYQAGVGVDFQLTRQLILSAGYEYLNLGSFSSWTGAGPWYNQTLNLGKYRANTAIVSVNYLIDE